MTSNDLERGVREAILDMLSSEIPLDYFGEIDLKRLLNPTERGIPISSVHAIASLLVYAALKGNWDAQKWVVSVIDRHLELPFGPER